MYSYTAEGHAEGHDRLSRVRATHTRAPSGMQIIWLQRPRQDLPWGFRLQGGREFGQPLSIQRVNPGSVAFNSLNVGDIILKVNNTNVTNVSHNEGQDLINTAGNLLQLTIKKACTVAASAPVSPTPMSQCAMSFTAPTSPTSFRGFSPVSDGLPSFRNVYTDDENFDNPRYFASLPRHASISGGSHSIHNNADFHNQQYGRKNSAPYGIGGYSMPRPQPYRPSTGNMSTSHMRSGSDSSGYQTSSYGPSPNTFDSPISSGNLPHTTSSTSYKSTPASYGYGPGPGIAPPTYESSIEDRRAGTISSTAYQRQQSLGSQGPSAFNQNGDTHPPEMNRYESSQMSSQHQRGNNSFESSSPYSQFQRQPSREDVGQRYNTYEQSDYNSYNQHKPVEVVQQSGYHRQPSYGYQRQPSFGSTPQSPPVDRNASPSGFRRQTSQKSNVNVDNYSSPPRGYQRQTSSERIRGSNTVSNPGIYQRQTSSGSIPKSPVYQATISSPPQTHGSSYMTSDHDATSGQSRYENSSPAVSTKSSGTEINSIEDILSPFDKFPNYYNEFIKKSNEGRYNGSSGIVSDIPEPRSYQTPTYSTEQTPKQQNTYNSAPMYQPYQPTPQQLYGDQGFHDSVASPPPPPPPPAPVAAPPPPPPPPAPPVPTQGWNSPRRPEYKSRDERTPGDGSPVPPGYGQERVPDAILNTMMKQGGSGTPKPFAYFTGGIDLKEFKNKRNWPPPPVMPKSYRGPNLDDPPVMPPQPVQQQTTQQSNRSPQPYQPTRVPPSPPVRTSSGYPEKTLKDIEKSAVYQMIQESENEGKQTTTHEHPSARYFSPPTSPKEQEPESPSTSFVSPQYKHGRSFHVLQWLTETDDVVDAEEESSSKPRRMKEKDPTLRHNAEDDEMRFSGLHSKRDIPSKAFARLNKMAPADVSPNVQQQSDDQQDNEIEDPSDQVGKYEQASIRYMGKHIPSPSFRVLQNWAEVDQQMAAKSDPQPTTQSDDDLLDDTDDGLPDTLSGDELTDRRYMGGHIPSRSFKFLQMSIGEDPNPKPKRIEEEQAPTPQPVSEPPQPVQQPTSAPRKLQIVTKSRAVPQAAPEDSPSTDF